MRLEKKPSFVIRQNVLLGCAMSRSMAHRRKIVISSCWNINEMAPFFAYPHPTISNWSNSRFLW